MTAFNRTRLCVFVAISGLTAGAATAAFEARSLDANPSTAEAWYDTATGLTWLKDVGANATAAGIYTGSVNTSSYTAASNWAAGLVWGGSSDWRIPTLAEAQALQTAGFLTPAYFDGMGTAADGFWNQAFMWTSTDLTAGVSKYAIRISGTPLPFLDGAVYDRGFQVFGVAAANLGQPLSPVPEPSAYALMGLGLLGLSLARRRANREDRENCITA